jgi:hypothetical protein
MSKNTFYHRCKICDPYHVSTTSFGTYAGLGPNNMKIPKFVMRSENPLIKLGNQYGARSFKEFVM